jgi:hypothetical protein
MRVVLRPYLELEQGWRGAVAPRSHATWWREYRRFILFYARLARSERAEGLVIGTEMRSLSSAAGRWRALVREVRRSFRGWVTYQANWDEFEDVTWWGALDVISISAYFPLVSESAQGVDELMAGWRGMTGRRDWTAAVESFAARQRQPVFFGEIGYRPLASSPSRPWDIEAEGRTDPATQAAAYEAALRVWFRRPSFRGMHWWYVAPNPAGVAGRPGADHAPTTAARRVLRMWYRRGPGG